MELPPAEGAVVALDIETRDGFVPFALDPANGDKRTLGAWIALAEPPKE